MNSSIYPSTRSIVLSIVATVGVLLVHAVLHWLDVPAGDLLDWVTAIAGFWWLLGVVTIPWNIYFGARRVLSEFDDSTERGIELRDRDVAYVRQAARRSLPTAIALHGLSALGFGAVAYLGLTPVGWFVAVAALALTLLRPAVRLYQHVVAKLTDISRRSRYPRDDVETLRCRVDELEWMLKRHESTLDPDEEGSLVSRLHQRLARLDERLDELRHEQVDLRQSNDEEHHKLRREAEAAADRLAEDSQFLGNVREIIRFVKEA